MRETYRITFQPDGRSVFVIRGTALIEAAGQAGIILNSPCGGKGTCGKCRVQIQLNPPEPGEADKNHLSAEEIADGYRLACQCRIQSDMVVYVPENVRFFEQAVLSQGHERQFDLEPNVRKCHITLSEPVSTDLRSDQDRLMAQMYVECEKTEMSLEMTRTVPSVLRKSNFDLTAVSRGDGIG